MTTVILVLIAFVVAPMLYGWVTADAVQRKRLKENEPTNQRRER